MRRWSLLAAVLVAVAGLAIAVSLPAGTIRVCPSPHIGGLITTKCDTVSDSRPILRFVIGLASVVPALVLLGLAYRRRRWFRIGFVCVGLAIAFGLWWIGGLVPANNGDCPPYPRCFTIGHPYAGPAFLVVVGTLIAAFWMSMPYLAE
jgi:hypothetical protein